MFLSWVGMEMRASEFFLVCLLRQALTEIVRFERYSEEDTAAYGQTHGRDPHAALFAEFGPQTTL